MLGRVGQMISLGYAGGIGGNWNQTKADGTSSPFSLAPGQSFVMTEFRGRFYAADPATDTGPYRIYLLGPNSSAQYAANLTDFTYPGSVTVSGGVLTELNLQPGYVFIAPPTPQARPQNTLRANTGAKAAIGVRRYLMVFALTPYDLLAL